MAGSREGHGEGLQATGEMTATKAQLVGSGGSGGRPPRWALLLLVPPFLFAISREQKMMESSVELESSTHRARSRIQKTLDTVCVGGRQAGWVRATPYYSEADGDDSTGNLYDAVELADDEEQWSGQHFETRAKPIKPTDETASGVSTSIREGWSKESAGAVRGHPHEPYLNRWQRRFNSTQHEEGYLFFKHIRKAGGTSARIFFQEALIYHKNNRNHTKFKRANAVRSIYGNWNGTDKEVQYVEQEFQTMDYKCHQVDPRWNNSLTFIILRHPIERHMSEFFYSGPGSRTWTIDKSQLFSNETHARLFVDYLAKYVPKFIEDKGKSHKQKGKFNKFFGRFYVDNFQLRSLAGCADETCLQQEKDGIEPLDLEEIYRLHPENYTYNEINPVCTNYFRQDEPRGVLFERCAKQIDEKRCPIGCDGPCFYPAVAWQSMTSDHVSRALSALERYDAVLLNEKLSDVDQSNFVSDIVGVPRDADFSMNNQVHNSGVKKTSDRERTHFYRDLLYKLHRPTLEMLEEENKLEIQLYEKAREINSKQLNQWRRENGYDEIGFQPEASSADYLDGDSPHSYTAIVQSEVAVEDKDETRDLISKDAEPYTDRWQRRFAASESRGKKTGFLFFKHIRKAGGSTLRSYLHDVLEYRNNSRAFIFSESAQRAYDTEAMARMKTGQAIAKIFSYKQRRVDRGEIAVPTGYTVNYIEQEFEAMDWTCPSVDPRFDDSLSVIVLRHPVERQMSEFFYSGPLARSEYRFINTTLLYVDERYTEGLANLIRDELTGWLDLDYGYPIKKKSVQASQKHTFYSPFGRYYTSNYLIRSLAGCSTEDCLDKYDFPQEDRALMNQQADALKSYSEPNSNCSLFFVTREMMWDVCSSHKKGGKRSMGSGEECPLGCDGPCHYPAISFGDIDDLQLDRAKASLRNFDAVMITDTMSEEDQSDFLSDVLGTPRDAKFALKNRTLVNNFRVEKTNRHDKSRFYRDLLNNLGLKDEAARLRKENKLDAKLFSYAEKLNAQMLKSWKHERSNVEDQDHPHHDSSVLIVMYHKTGYVLTRHLAKSAIDMEFQARGRAHKKNKLGPSLDNFDEETGEQIAFGLRGNWNSNFVRARSHSPITKCHPKFQLSAGAIHLQEAPDFFCSDSEVLDSMLDKSKQGKKTTKIVHFIRNPFSMVLSNYFYHAQSPTPEKWVHTDEPCEHNYKSGGSLAESVLPILASRTRIQRHHFDEVVNICVGLYQTRESLKNSTFYEHLLEMDHYDGLRLATAQMIISSSAANRNLAGGDILRMASNIIKLDNLQSNSALPQDKREMVHIMSITMEDYMKDKGNKTLQFFDFIFGQDNDLITEEIKLDVVSKHDRMSDRKKNGSHVTQGKHADRDELRGRLMADPVFGLILNETEMLVNQAAAKKHR